MATPDAERRRSGRLIPVAWGESRGTAFAPDPLPPRLDYDAELVGAVAEAHRQLGELAGLARQVPNSQLLIQPFIRREAVLSSRIEGTQADVAELYAYEAGQIPLPGLTDEVPEADVQEVANYVRAMEYGLTRLSTLPVSRRLLRELHERLLSGVRGRDRAPGDFRTIQNWIGPPGSRLAEATYVPPPVPDMETALDDLERYINEDDLLHPPLVRLAFIHYQFEAIHPFLDGNGRIGRLLITLLLVHWGLLPLPLLYLSAFFERHRNEYYEGLLGVSSRGEWRDWVLLFLRGVATQALAAARLARRLQDLQAEWHRRLIAVRGSTLLIRLADRLFERPFTTVPEAAGLLQVTYPSAKRSVEKLVGAGILEWLEGVANPRVLVAREVLEVVRTEPDEERYTEV